jgi:hypothetical protein
MVPSGSAWRAGDLDLHEARVDIVGTQRALDDAAHVLTMELLGRQIDGDPHGRHAGPQPRADLPAGALQHPASGGTDQPRFFQGGNELARRHQAPLGMAPAQQRFDPRDVTAAEAHLRLEVQEELVPLERAPQIGVHLGALQLVLVHFRGVELIVVPTEGLGPQHRGVGMLHEGVGVIGVRGEHRDPDARGDEDLTGVQLKRHRQGIDDLLRDPGRILLGIQFGEHDCEFVAAQPPHRVLAPDARGDALGDLLQEFVAGFVPVSLISLNRSRSRTGRWRSASCVG